MRTKEELLHIAAELFAERGFDGTSTRELVKKARCNIALISYHFGGKEGLYQALLDEHLKKIQEIFLKSSEDDESHEKLKKLWPEFKTHSERKLCDSLFESSLFVLKNEQMQRIFMREFMGDAKNLIRVFKKNDSGLISNIIKVLEQLQAEKKLDPKTDPKLAAVALVGPLVYSICAKPLITEIYRLKVDEKYMRSLCVHQTRSFFGGYGV